MYWSHMWCHWMSGPGLWFTQETLSTSVGLPRKAVKTEAEARYESWCKQLHRGWEGIVQPTNTASLTWMISECHWYIFWRGSLRNNCCDIKYLFVIWPDWPFNYFTHISTSDCWGWPNRPKYTVQKELRDLWENFELLWGESELILWSLKGTRLLSVRSIS